VAVYNSMNALFPPPNIPAGGGAKQQIAGLTNLGNLTTGYASQALQDAFDPQKALFNQNLSTLNDQTGSALAQSGLGSTPYAAEVKGSTDSSFLNNWQSQQVQREATGMATATGSGAPLMQAGQLDLGAVGNLLDAYGLQGQNYSSAINAIAALMNAQTNALAQSPLGIEQQALAGQSAGSTRSQHL
jgi:hypothetical protein